MNSKSQQALNVLTKWATEETLNMENEEAAEFLMNLQIGRTPNTRPV